LAPLFVPGTSDSSVVASHVDGWENHRIGVAAATHVDDWKEHRVGLLFERDQKGCVGSSCAIYFIPILTNITA
jgi:hypothetical protein